jgi:hypothetical protein
MESAVGRRFAPNLTGGREAVVGRLTLSQWRLLACFGNSAVGHQFCIRDPDDSVTRWHNRIVAFGRCAKS